LISKPTLHEIPGLIYGGFWIRFYAKMLDWIICSVLIAVLPLFHTNTSDVIIVSNYSGILSFFSFKWVIPALYTTVFLANYQATPGKMVFSLQVVTENQQKITYGIALARFFSEMISAFLLFIGYLVSIFDIKKRTLHDRICQTYVVQSKQVLYHNANSMNLTDEGESFHSERAIHDNNIYGIHTILFSMMIFESLFTAAYCIMEDPLFRMSTWALNVLIGIFLMISLFKQKYPNFSSSIKRLTWGICLYYCVITPIIYSLFILIGLEHFFNEVSLIMDDPILFIMQLLISITHFFVLFSWPKVLMSVIFIPCSLILGLWGIILVSSCKGLSQEQVQ
jgi:uncharacterized RDD family membrane protein YckC